MIVIYFFHYLVYENKLIFQGAARRLTTQGKNLVEIESVGVAGKSDGNRVKKYFRLEV